MSILQCCLIVVLAPLVGSIFAGFFRQQIGRVGAHSITIASVGLSLIFSIYVAILIYSGNAPILNSNLYTWANGGDLFPFSFHIGFLIDPLTVTMMVIVSFVSFLVHVYTIGYMADDDGYQRFFSYISLFTFMMLMLVTANNFLQHELMRKWVLGLPSTQATKHAMGSVPIFPLLRQRVTGK